MKNEIYGGRCQRCGDTISDCLCQSPEMKKFHDVFEEETLVYFLEDQFTGQWLSVSDRLTSDPHEALSFDSRAHAQLYLRNKGYNELIVTEHMFL